MKLPYILRLADDALIMGHRLSEWCGHGPILEQDIALSNIALDHLGRARSLYQYAAELYNQMDSNERQGIFSSVALAQIIKEKGLVDEDSLAYLRDGWDFKNILLTEQPNGDWAQTVAKSFYYDTFNELYFAGLAESNDATLAAIAEKSLKEITYHVRWSSEWVIRLGDGTEESHEKMKQAIEAMWMFTGEMFTPANYETPLINNGTAPDTAPLKANWLAKVASVLAEATLAVPTGTWMQQGGKEGRHTELLGYLLAEMQFMQRAYPGMEW
ncbi:MAG: phenylacetate-CoA oxygenase subunit PaaI [Chitinophagia bacterium]|nr:phenylacetate-CoA oxygenase subunit PaaI [Chitinophagia bacterium]